MARASSEMLVSFVSVNYETLPRFMITLRMKKDNAPEGCPIGVARSDSGTKKNTRVKYINHDGSTKSTSALAWRPIVILSGTNVINTDADNITSSGPCHGHPMDR